MTLRINLGTVFAGLVVLLIGVGLFVLWTLMAILSFFFFFVPVLHGFFYLTLYVLAASLVLLGSGALVMFTGASGWGGSHLKYNRSEGFVSRRARKDRMGIGERCGEVIGLLVSSLILLFFVENQVRGTGLFTAEFKTFEQFVFYGPWVLGAFVTLTRVVYGRRNAVRPMELLQGAFLGASAFWLLSVFPFDFSHLTALMPPLLQTSFSWVNDTVGEIVLLLAGVGSVANLVYTAFLYASVRTHMALGGARHL